MSETFEGFPAPTKNFFSLPNEMVNIIAHIKNLAELKVIIYVMRHTWGYHEYGIYKTISVDEFMHGRKREDGSRMDQGTGLSNRSVIDGLRDAVQHGYLICDVDASDLARVKKSYALRMINRGELSSPHEDTSYSEDTTPRYEDTSRRYEESSQLGEDTSHRSEKYTTRKTLKKDTLERQVFDASASTSAPVDINQWKTDSEKRRAMFADVPLSKDEGEDISMLETRKQEATDPAVNKTLTSQTPAPGMSFVEARDYLRSLGYFLEPTPSMNGWWEIREPYTNGFDVIKGDQVIRRAEYIRKQQTPAAGVPAISPHGSDASAQALSVSFSGIDAAQRTASPGGAVQASIPKRHKGKVAQAILKTPEELAMDERCRALQVKFNEWRGYALEQKGQIINERKSIRTLAERYSDERIQRDYLYLFNRHWKWSKPDNRYHIGAWVVLSEAESIEQELKGKPAPQSKQDENIGVSGLPRLQVRKVNYG